MILHHLSRPASLLALMLLLRVADAGGTEIASPEANAGPAAGGHVVHEAAVDFATLWASDILLTDTLLEYRQVRTSSELTLGLSHGHIGLHYVPEPSPLRIFGVLKQNDLNDERYGVQARGRIHVSNPLTLIVAGGLYEGFTDYRSLWLDEYYRQLDARNSRHGLGYRPADPRGWNASTGLRWEYWPSAGFLQGEVRYQHDVIAPGYNVTLHTYPLKLVRQNDQLDTFSGRLTLENVIGSRLRALQEFQIADITDRELRFTLQSSLNWVPAWRWALRLALGGATEAPSFDAWWVSSTLERDWNETWFVNLLARYYKDTGQIENSLPSSSNAAPPVETYQIGLGFRLQGRRSSAKLVVGPYFSHYSKDGPVATSFAHLYQSRDWFSLQLAFAHTF